MARLARLQEGAQLAGDHLELQWSRLSRSRSAPLTLGRNQDNDLVLDHPSFPLLTSRKHASLKLVGDALELADLKSLNGTYCNGVRVAAELPVRVKDGDVVSFGGPIKIKKDASDAVNPFIFRLDGLADILAHHPGENQEIGPSTANFPTLEPGATSMRPERVLWSQMMAVVDLTLSSDDEEEGFVRLRRTGWAARVVAEQMANNRARAAAHMRLDAPVGSPVEIVDPEAPAPKRAKTSAAGPANLSTAAAERSATAAAPAPTPIADGAGGPSKAADAAAGASGPHNDILEAMREQCECAICREWMVAPHTLANCGHLFCGECMAQWLEKKHDCPNCRVKVTGPPVRTHAIENLMAVVEKKLSGEELEERERRKASWAAKGPEITRQWKAKFERGSSAMLGDAYRRDRRGHGRSDGGYATMFGPPGPSDFDRFLAFPDQLLGAVDQLRTVRSQHSRRGGIIAPRDAIVDALNSRDAARSAAARSEAAAAYGGRGGAHPAAGAGGRGAGGSGAGDHFEFAPVRRLPPREDSRHFRMPPPGMGLFPEMPDLIPGLGMALPPPPRRHSPRGALSPGGGASAPSGGPPQAGPSASAPTHHIFVLDCPAGRNRTHNCAACGHGFPPRQVRVGMRDAAGTGASPHRWYHVGCMPGALWQEARLPGRLIGMRQLSAEDQAMVNSQLRR
ncbi:hypothetical protein WJX72_006531 [[Myrmecia] bisecta]|uniref:E3 ubiquitin-protein ligase CHFR n=1 Tax=[Myrmecia] bisecta TaxID=41462 RepID=A0AAW1PLG3_9CHLO